MYGAALADVVAPTLCDLLTPRHTSCESGEEDLKATDRKFRPLVPGGNLVGSLHSILLGAIERDGSAMDPGSYVQLLDPVWPTYQKQIARSSNNHALMKAIGMPHAIPRLNSAIVVEAVKQVYQNDVRRGHSVKVCGKAFTRLKGKCIESVVLLPK